MILALFIGLLTGVLSGFGIGGGSLLMVYLTLAADLSQFEAGGINLLYFVACAPAALYSHIKNKMIILPAVKYCVLAGIPASILAAMLASHMQMDLLRRLFGVLLLVIGVKEILAGREKHEG